jgi:GNAT superfamily N-acetyltransferase
MITNIRKPKPADLNYIFDIDLKCFEDYLSIDGWLEYLEGNYSLLVAIVKGLPVGVIVWQDNIIKRIAVKPANRGNGVGSQLLQAVENSLVQKGFDLVMINVPESMCCPGQPHDVSHWLSERKFLADGVEKDAALYCQQKEDLFRFTKILSEVIIHG